MIENKSLTTTNSLLNDSEMNFAVSVNEILNQTKEIAIQSNPIIKGLMQAVAMEKINQLITPEMMKPIEKLFGSSIGIKTDAKYNADTMKRIFIEATIGGWGIVGNQINVLAGNMYVTKNGYLPRLREFPGLKFTFPFKHQLPVQDETHKTWSVTSEISWELDGVKHKEIITNPTRKQDGQSADALWGKADTKCCRFLWNKVTGQETMDDSSAGEFTEAEVTKGDKKPEQVKTASNIPEQKKSESGEEIPVMVSNDIQEKFNSFISKSISLDHLIERAKNWCETPKAKELGVKYEINGVIFTSQSLDLKVFNELAMNFSQNQ